MNYWSEKKARWYSKALKGSDYPEKVMEVILPLMDSRSTVLDVGAGCGAITLPLAEKVRSVTAVEPSEAMLNVLKEEAASRKLGNIECVPYRWEEAEVDPHDVVLCANVRNLLHENIRFLSSIGRYSRRHVILISGAGTENDKFFFKELVPMIHGRRVGPKRDYLTIYQNLHSLGIYANVQLISYNLDQVFADMDEACDFWKEYLSLEGDEHLEILREFLAKRLVEDEAGLRARVRKESAIIWWQKER